MIGVVEKRVQRVEGRGVAINLAKPVWPVLAGGRAGVARVPYI